MHNVEKQLLTFFDLMKWVAVYHPICFCGGDADLFEPSFYIHSIRLFVNCGDVPRSFEEKIIDGECWRFLSGCPKPDEVGIRSIRDLIQQPALLRMPLKRCAPIFAQYRDMPGDVQSEGMVQLGRCESCKEWSPQANYSDWVCRVCGMRDINGDSITLSWRADGHGLEFVNGWGESLEIPENDKEFTGKEPFLIRDPMCDKPRTITGLTVFGAFERMLKGPAAGVEETRELPVH